MKVIISKGVANGEINAIPSKSYAHRLILASALSNQPCKIDNVKFNNDVKATLNCIKALSKNFSIEGDSISLFGGINLSNDSTFDCLESGSTLRFIIPIALALTKKATFCGTERLIERGIGVYEKIFSGQVEFIKEKDKIITKGQIKSGEYRIKGNISSQFITGMLFALPLLDGDSTIKIIPPFESKDYVLLTLDVLKRFGVKIDNLGERSYKIYGNQTYKAVDSVVEGDWSNGAFMHALNVIGGKVSVLGLDDESLQGDKNCVEIFEKLRKGYAKINLKNTPDLAPISFAIAGAMGGAKFVGTKRLKIKESDRASAMKQELSKFGVLVKVSRNSVKVYNSQLKAPTEAINGHNDHRIVMATAVLLTLVGGEIEGAEAINKSYPNFFGDLQKLGIEVIKNA